MKPSITDIISTIRENIAALSITLYPPATDAGIAAFEHVTGCRLPDDFIAFYRFCNGFDAGAYIFRMIPLDEIIRNGNGTSGRQIEFAFAEYMIYSDDWTIMMNTENPDDYLICASAGSIILSDSLAEFLQRFINGDVFDGLYIWMEEKKKLHP